MKSWNIGSSLLGALFVVLGLLSQVQQSSANVMGIDFASDAMKVALVQAGTPMEIVTNFQSKRKTPTCLTFYKGERLYGSDANALMARKPDLTFCKAYRLLGKRLESPIVQALTKEQYFPYELYTNESTGMLTFKQEDTQYTPEEIIGMIMQHAKEIAASFGEGKKVKDCVITVPSYFTQHERAAVYSAAEIAELNVLSLIEENTAAALHYGIDRVAEEKPTKVLFYNMGAGSTQVTIVQHSSYVTREGFSTKNKTVGQFEVVGKAWDAELGGFNFDLRLADLLADRFNSAWHKKKSGAGQDLREHVRPMTRLRQLANQVKEVLSANQEFPVKADQLHADVDLNTKVTRAEFEEAARDLLDRVTGPIDRALSNAGLSLGDIDSVELLGGGVRVPRVKKLLEEYFSQAEPKIDLGQHMNGDEAMAMGAAFRAANLSTSFKVRKVGIADSTSFGVSVRLETLPVAEDAETSGWFGSMLNKAAAAAEGFVSADGSTAADVSATAAAGKEGDAPQVWTKFTSLYPVNSRIPSKVKTVAFTYDKDLLCHIEYDAVEQGESTANAPVGGVKRESATDAENSRVGGIVPPEGSEAAHQAGETEAAAALLAERKPNLLPALTHPLIASFNITGVAAFAKENKGRAGLPEDALPKVHLSFSIDGSGMVQLVKAEATLELPPPLVNEAEEEVVVEKKDTEAAESAAGSEGKTEAEAESRKDGEADSAESKKDGEADSAESKKDGEADSVESERTEDKKSDPKDKKQSKSGAKADAAKKKPKKPTATVLRRTLTVSSNAALLTPPQWSEAQKAEARARLALLTKRDEERKEKEAANNELEAYVYRVKNRMADEEDELDKVSSSEERAAVVEAATAAEDWLYDEGRAADLAAYKIKHAELRDMAEAIFHKYDEIEARSLAVEAAQKKLRDMKTVAGKWAVSKPHINETERDTFSSLLAEEEAWIEERLQAQLVLSLKDKPAFESVELGAHMRPLSALFSSLNKRKPPPPPPVQKDKDDKKSSGSTKGKKGTEEEGSAAQNNSSSSDSDSDSAEAGSDDTIKVELETESGDGSNSSSSSSE